MWFRLMDIFLYTHHQGVNININSTDTVFSNPQSFNYIKHTAESGMNLFIPEEGWCNVFGSRVGSGG